MMIILNVDVGGLLYAISIKVEEIVLDNLLAARAGLDFIKSEKDTPVQLVVQEYSTSEVNFLHSKFFSRSKILQDH